MKRKNAGKLAVWRGFGAKKRAPRRRKIAAHELLNKPSDKPVLELLHITNETVFEISTDGRNLILSPQIEKNQETTIMNSLEKINKKYGKVLKKLGN